jgi:two-component system OmpR family sensor kinase
VIPIQIWDENGQILRSTPPNTHLPRQPVTGFSDLTTKEGDWRIYTLVSSEGTVQVSQQVEVRQELALNAALPALITVGLLVPLSWLLVRWLVGRILLPLDRVALQLSARQPESTLPLTLEHIPDEILPLVTAMNQALARVSSAFLSQKRFVSDAAHQLRTPLTALRLQMRNLMRDPEARAATVLPDMEVSLQRMSGLTNQLLVLARAETPSAENIVRRVRLSEVLNEVVSAVRPLAQHNNVTLEAVSQVGFEILADRDDLVTLFSNLVDNAVRYTPPGGAISFSIGLSEGHTRVEIADTGPGLPVGMLHKVFERFVRATDKGEGTGLGLSIAKAIADRINARISLQNRIDRSGLIARVDLLLGVEDRALRRASGPGIGKQLVED